MTPEQKHEWIKAWTMKWHRANGDLYAAKDLLGEESLRYMFRSHDDDYMDSAIKAAKEAYISEGRKVEAKLLAELREIESMIEVKQ